MNRERLSALCVNAAQLVFLSMIPAVIIVWVLVDFPAAMGTLGGQIAALFLLAWAGMKLSRSGDGATEGPRSDGS